ncbi:MAG: damage-control phosphatase ARMT1 family protein [Spirochaetaceae bacterium]
MQAALDCMSCFVRQALEAARLAAESEAVHTEVMKRVLAELSDLDLRVTPPEVGGRVHALVQEITGVADPYGPQKRRFTEQALALLPALERRVRASERPFETALRYAAAGNVIDLGVNGTLAEAEVERALAEAESKRLDAAAVEALYRAAASADTVLFIADNAGELVFDRMLIEQLPAAQVTVAVKGGPVLNDATRADAEQARIGDVARIIDTGQATPGVVLETTGPEFRRAFARSDLVIAKGQGNYEGLSTAPREVFFLLTVKCSVVAADLGAPLGTLHIGRRRPEDDLEEQAL